MPAIQIQTDIPSLERDRLNREMRYAVDNLASAQSSMIAELKPAFAQVTNDDVAYCKPTLIDCVILDTVDDITHGGVECWGAEIARLKNRIANIQGGLLHTVWTD